MTALSCSVQDNPPTSKKWRKGLLFCPRGFGSGSSTIFDLSLHPACPRRAGPAAPAPPLWLCATFFCAELWDWQLKSGHQGKKAERTRPGHLAMNDLLVQVQPPCGCTVQGEEGKMAKWRDPRARGSGQGPASCAAGPWDSLVWNLLPHSVTT